MYLHDEREARDIELVCEEHLPEDSDPPSKSEKPKKFVLSDHDDFSLSGSDHAPEEEVKKISPVITNFQKHGKEKRNSLPLMSPNSAVASINTSKPSTGFKPGSFQSPLKTQFDSLPAQVKSQVPKVYRSRGSVSEVFAYLFSSKEMTPDHVCRLTKSRKPMGQKIN
jgi:hypothetical protein